MGADVIGVGDAEVDVEGQGLLPVVAGLVRVAGAVVGVGETVVGTGLFVAPISVARVSAAACTVRARPSCPLAW